MFDDMELLEMRQHLASFASRFDAELLDGAGATAVVEQAAAIENMAVSIKARAALRVAATQAHRVEGLASAAHQLAKVSGIGVGRARQQLATAERVQSLPAVAAAQRDGSLSADKASVVAEAASLDPTAELRLLVHARRRWLGELKLECARVKAAADPDPDATYRRIHSQRSCRRRSTAEGGAEITYRSTLDEVSQVWSVISGYANTAFDLARVEGRQEAEDAYAADGLLAMARAAAGGGVTTSKVEGKRTRKPAPVKIIYRVDWAAYRRGWVEAGETCEIAGVGPVPISAIKGLYEDDPFVAAVVTEGEDVVSVAHLGRSPRARQLTALEWMHPSCTREGCNSTVRLQNDHRDDWAATHTTPTDGLDPLCKHDHDLKTRYGWALVTGKGRRPMVPPGHPDHPGQPREKNRAPPG